MLPLRSCGKTGPSYAQICLSKLQTACKGDPCVQLMACAGVDGSNSMAEIATQICRENGLSSLDGGPISIIAGQVEQVQDLGTCQVQDPFHSEFAAALQETFFLGI